MAFPSKIVYEEVDLRLSPVQAYDQLRRGAGASFLLESADASSRKVAYSFLGASSERTLIGEDDRGSLVGPAYVLVTNMHILLELAVNDHA